MKKKTREQILFPANEQTHKNQLIKEYSFPINPDFYISLIQNIPTLKFDFSSTIYNRLIKQYSQLSLPHLTTAKDVKTRTLNRIRGNCITLARCLQKPPSTESLLAYSSHKIFKERIISARTMNFLTKKTISKKNTKEPSGNVNLGFFNCFRLKRTYFFLLCLYSILIN